MNAHKMFRVVRVVTKHFASDWLQGLRNTLGLRMTGYENMIQEELDDIFAQIAKTGELDWFRVETDELTDKGVMIIVYGCYK